jgi:ribosomal protein L3 glutamine methyltransferase
MMSNPLITELQTVRDFIRYGGAEMHKANLVYGHGTDNPYDESFFIVCEIAHLPFERAADFYDAKLTSDEREKILSLITARIQKRIPAAYLLNKAYMHGYGFYVDERVIIPRSYLGEYLASSDLTAFIPAPESITHMLDLCTGSGCLAIMAADAFPHAQIDAVDLSADALLVAKRNVDDYNLNDRITLIQSDLFSALKHKKYDFIISNPPYVTADAVEHFPPEYQQEPKMAHLGGADGMDLVRRILKESPAHLKTGGSLMCELGFGQDIINEEFTNLNLTWLSSEKSYGEIFWYQP